MTYALPERMPPCDLEAEQALLGSMILHRDGMAEAFAVIRPDESEALYSPVHRTLWVELAKMFDSNQQNDILLVRNTLTEHGLLNDVGGVSYLVELMESVPSHLHARYYAGVVRDKWFARRVIEHASKLTSRAYENPDPNDLRDLVGETFTNLSERRTDAEPKTMATATAEVFEELRSLREGGPRGLSTGFWELDAMLGGWHESELIVVAARPSMGKTALVTSMLVSAAKLGCPVLFFSVEMRWQDIVMRIMCGMASVDSNRVRRGLATEDDLQQLQRAQAELEVLPMWIDDTPALHIMDLLATARSYRRSHRIGLVAVDYLQLVRGIGRERQLEVADISRRLKAISRELKVPVVAVAQLNRKSEDRSESRPRMSDLRESGAIEQDADVVMLLHRQEYYDKDKTDDRLKGVAELMVEKQRNGPTGIVRLSWNPTYTRFANLSATDDPASRQALAELSNMPRLTYADDGAAPF